jgi:hypothetical protein
MQQPATLALYAYWNEVRCGRLAPHRLEIEPARIAAVLSETFMLQRLEAGDYQYRLAGTRLCELFGSELRGRNFLGFWGTADVERLKGCLAAVCERGAVLLVELELGDDARTRVDLEAILLPLLYGDRISRVLGAMSGAAAAGWPLALTGRCRLVRQQLIWPDAHPNAVLDGRGNGAPARPSAAGGSRTLHQFRVLEGGRSDKQRR